MTVFRWIALAVLAVGCAVNPVPTPASGGAGGGAAAATDAGGFAAGVDAGATAGGGADTLAPAFDAVAAAPDAAAGETSVDDASDATTAGDSGASDGTAQADAATPSDAAGDVASAPDAAPPAQTLPPTEAKALAVWLASGAYQAWAAESKVHGSAGPHFGGVKTFVSDKLLASLTKGDAAHPVDAAAVKELYGSGTTVLGWSVMRKTQGGAGGATWWWYEDYGGKVYAAGQGASLCTGCHAPGKDYFLSQFPLQ